MDHGHGIESGKGPDHQHITVGKVDELQNPVDHAVTERDQGVDRPERKSVDHLLQELVHGEKERAKAEG